MTVRSLLLTAILSFVCIAPASAQWQKLPVFTNEFFNEVQFVDNTHGWVTRQSPSVSRTVDGGNTWASSDLPGATGSSNRDICFLSRTVGFVSGEDGIWKTTNGGTTWTTITPAGFVSGSAGMWFTDANTGVYGVGGCLDSTVTFYRTTDGGSTWSSVSYTSTADVSVGGITHSAGVWYASGGRGKFWSSNDGGASWTMTNTRSNGWQEDIFVYNGDLHIASTNGSTCGVSGGGTLLRSTNSGSSWTVTSYPSNLMWGVTRYSSTEGWACGDGGLALKTTDGGATWVEQSCGIARNARLDDIHFTDATHGFVVGDGIYRLADQAVDVTPDTIDFGALKMNTKSADSNARVRSFFASATTASLRITGTDASQFEITNGITSLAMGVCSQSMVPVLFAPTSRGAKTALLEITVASSPLRRVVVLRGRGLEPEISVLAKPMLDTMICGTSIIDSILIRNLGSAPLTITRVTHADPPGGSLVPVAPTLPASIAPGSQMWLKVLATAREPGLHSSQLEIHNDDPAPGRSPFLVRIAYYRRRTEAVIAGDSLTLPSTLVGARSGTTCIEYRNRGDGAQTIDTIIGSAAGVIVPSGMTFPITVASGAATKLCFDATPADTGWFSRTFIVRSQPCMLATPLSVRVYGRSAIVRSDSLVTMPAITCETSARESVALHNDGNDTLVLDRPTISGRDAGGARIASPSAWPLRIAPGEFASVIVELEPTTSSADATATLTFATNDRSAKRALWSIRFETTRTSATARPTQASIDAGSHCKDATIVVPLYIESVGTASARVVGARVIGDSPGLATIAVAPTGRELDPGARDSLSVQLSPTGIGSFTARVEIRTEPCARIDTVEIFGTSTEVLLRSDDNLTLGTLLKGRAATAVARVHNDGNVTTTYTARTTSTQFDVVAPAGNEIAPGEMAEITVTINTDDVGPVAGTLEVISLSECPDTLLFDVSANVVEEGGVSIQLRTRELRFGSLYRCEDSCSDVELESVGSLPVTITSARIDGPTGSIRLGDFMTPYEIAPGATLKVPVCYVPVGDDDRSRAELVLQTTDSANAELRIPLSGSSMGGLTTIPSLSFGVVGRDTPVDTTFVVSNPSSRALEITAARVPAPFELITALPQTIAPNASIELAVRARNVDDYALELLVLQTSHRCGDSLVIALDALSDDRYTVTTYADTMVGTWGKNIAVPIGFRDTTRARVSEMTLFVYAAPELLDPRHVSAGPGVSVERLGYDAESGALRLRVRTHPGATIASHDSLVVVIYAVLRGDAIATSITPVALGLRPGVTSETEPGEFMLADYCDAHSRLLVVTGDIALEQNVPNPAQAKTVIEFETSFEDHVLLILFDARGGEVARLVDERMPAGRRRLELDAGRYPAGAYTYRLITGVQSLARRLIISP